MRLSTIPLRIFWHEKNHNIIAILALSITLMTSLVVNTAVGFINQTTSSYYMSLEKYDLIIEKQGTLVQFIPMDSVIDESIATEIENKQGGNAFPVIFKFFQETMENQLIPKIIAGFPLKLMKDYLQKVQVFKGRFPIEGKNEILIGYEISSYLNGLGGPVIGKQMDIYGVNFTVVGQFIYNNPIIDQFIFMPYNVSQQLFGLTHSCNMILVDRASLNNESAFFSFVDSNITDVKLIAFDDLIEISLMYSKMTSEWNFVVMLISYFLMFTFTVTIFLFNKERIVRRMREFIILGTSRLKILLYNYGELMFVLLFSFLLGFLLSFIIYPACVILVKEPMTSGISLGSLVMMEYSRWVPIIISHGSVVSLSFLLLVLITNIIPNLYLFKKT
ncbi:MAG: ABC transporter permease [Promethearchaeota archaeon]